MGTCPKCAAENRGGVRFCTSCGAPLPVEEPPGGAPPVAEVPAEPIAEKPPEAGPEAVPATPAVEEAPRVVLRITSAAETNREFPLSADETLIGQSAGCGVALPFDKFVSPEHACIRREGDRYVLEDRGSRNGVYVRVEGPLELRPGMEILIGTTRLRVCSAEKP